MELTFFEKIKCYTILIMIASNRNEARLHKYFGKFSHFKRDIIHIRTIPHFNIIYYTAVAKNQKVLTVISGRVVRYFVHSFF